MYDNRDGRRIGAQYAVAVVVIIAAVFSIGHWWGGGAVLESAKLKAEGEVLYQLITIQSESPTPDMLAAAQSVCNGASSTSQASCMNDFLSRYGQTWVVNLIDGTRVLLRADQPGAVVAPDSPASSAPVPSAGE